MPYSSPKGQGVEKMRLEDLEKLELKELKNLVLRLDKELDDEQRKNATLEDEINELERELVYRDNSPKGQGGQE